MSPARHEQILGQPRRLRTNALAIICLLSFLTLLLRVGLAFAGSVRTPQEIRQERVVVQKWNTSCGAAALATVLTYSLQYPVSEREVASGILRTTEPLKVKHRGGFSLLDMKHFVEAKGYRGDWIS